MDDNTAKIEELKARMAGLNLFSEDSAQREAAISSLALELQEPMRIFSKRSVDAMRLINILMMDMKQAGDNLQKDYQSQYLRRSSIRTLSALVEGLIYVMNQLIHSSAEFNGTSVSSEDEVFFRDGKITDKGKARFTPFRDYLKHTVDLYVKYSHSNCTISFADDGFAALCDTFVVRDRLMHPKSYIQISVSTKEIKRAGKAIEWVDNAVFTLIFGHNAELEKTIKERAENLPD